MSSFSLRSVTAWGAPRISPGQLDALKVLAFVTMVGDHVNKGLLQHGYPVLTLAGRFAFPLFAWTFAYSVVHHLRNEKRFLRISLVACAIVQWPFYEVLVPHEAAFRIGSLNALAPFIFAFLINRMAQYRLLRDWAVPIVFLIAGMLCFDASYGWAGIGLVLACIGFFRVGGAFYGALCVGMLAVCLLDTERMLLPVVAVALMCSSVGKLLRDVPRFLPRGALYVGYVAHVWLLLALMPVFHQ